jgi:hypothetical protein
MAGVTAIKHIRNSGNDLLLVVNAENPADTGGNGRSLRLAPGQLLPVNMWIPWADTEEQYLNGSRPGGGPAHINFVFSADGTVDENYQMGSITIWQSGPFVRYNEAAWLPNVHWIDNGPPVPGNSASGGDRLVEINWVPLNTMAIHFT